MVTHKDIQKTFFFLLHLPKPRNKKEATKEQSNLPSYFLDVIIITQKKAFKCLYLYLGNQGKVSYRLLYHRIVQFVFIQFTRLALRRAT